MVLKNIGKLSLAQLYEAAMGEFSVDITDDVKAALQSDSEAAALGILTKSVGVPGDSHVDATLAEVKAALADIGAAIAAVKADDSAVRAVDALKSDIADLKATVAQLMEQAKQNIMTAESVKSEIQDMVVPPPSASGGEPLTPEMKLLLASEAQKASVASKEFAFDTVEV